MLKARMACMALAVVVTSSSFASAGFFGRFSQRHACGYSTRVVYYPAYYCHPTPRHVIRCQPQYVTPVCCDHSSSVVYDGAVLNDCDSCSSSAVVHSDSEVIHSGKHDASQDADYEEERPVDPKAVDAEETEAEAVEKPKKLEDVSKAAS